MKEAWEYFREHVWTEEREPTEEEFIDWYSGMNDWISSTQE